MLAPTGGMIGGFDPTGDSYVFDPTRSPMLPTQSLGLPVTTSENQGLVGVEQIQSGANLPAIPTTGGGTGPISPSAAQLRMRGAGIGGIVGGIGAIAGGIADVRAGRQLRDRGAAEAAAATQELAELRAAQPSLDTPSEYYELVKGAYDQRLMQQRVEDINRSFATTAAAAGQFGARGLGAVLQASAQAEAAKRQEVLTQQKLQTQALGQLAQARERETRLRELRSTRDINLAFDAKRAGEAREFYGQQQRAQGIVSAIGGVAQVAGGAATLAAGIPTAKKGIKVTKTPGEFSHKRNPLSVTNKEGVKVAELTGGEYVFNPEQSKKLMKLAKEGDTPLHKFVRRLLERFEKESNG